MPSRRIPQSRPIRGTAFRLPFYAREIYTCRDCGQKTVWTPEQKYQYYEIENGNMYARRVRCDACYRKGTNP
ncbi:MAG: zinc-ribbon domain containing protein [Verrucomicrobiota bacterium]